LKAGKSFEIFNLKINKQNIQDLDNLGSNIPNKLYAEKEDSAD
jgi:hypothetical protein